MKEIFGGSLEDIDDWIDDDFGFSEASNCVTDWSASTKGKYLAEFLAWTDANPIELDSELPAKKNMEESEAF